MKPSLPSVCHCTGSSTPALQCRQRSRPLFNPLKVCFWRSCVSYLLSVVWSTHLPGIWQVASAKQVTSSPIRFNWPISPWNGSCSRRWKASQGETAWHKPPSVSAPEKTRVDGSGHATRPKQPRADRPLLVRTARALPHQKYCSVADHDRSSAVERCRDQGPWGAAGVMHVRPWAMLTILCTC